MQTCETVTVTVTDEAGNNTTVIVPAYTRSLPDMLGQVSDHLAAYVILSEGRAMSVGDFALFLLRQAASEPLEQ